MRRLARVLPLALLAAAAPALAGSTHESYVTERIRQSGTRDSFITFSHENDMLGGGTDQNYTSGARLTYFNLGTPMPPFMHAVDRLLPTIDINDTTSIYYSAGQNLYTPKDITRETQDPADRPWAGFLYVSAGINTITRNHVDNAELTAGVVGPAALGKQTQRFIHRYVSGSPDPRGWRNQLHNEPALMLSWERSWPRRYGFETQGWTAAAVPHLGATLGNVHTYANAGVSLRLGPSENEWQDDPVRVRPAMPGTGAFLVPEKTFSWHLFGGVEGRAVARNIFLDGNTFRDSYGVDKKHFVADASAGVALAVGKARVSYALVYRTEEFRAQDGGDVFGTVTLGVRF